MVQTRQALSCYNYNWYTTICCWNFVHYVNPYMMHLTNQIFMSNWRIYINEIFSSSFNEDDYTNFRSAARSTHNLNESNTVFTFINSILAEFGSYLNIFTEISNIVIEKKLHFLPDTQFQPSWWSDVWTYRLVTSKSQRSRSGAARIVLLLPD